MATGSSSPVADKTRSRRAPILAWAAVAVAARLGISWAAADSGLFADMLQYHERAVHLATTGTLLQDALRGPGYPALLAATFRLLGESLWSARIANVLVGGLLTLCTGWLARRAGAGPRAWIAAAIVALYPALVLSSVYVMPDGLYTMLAALCLALVSLPTASAAASAGLAAGAAMLTRSVGLALVASPVLVAAWSVARRHEPPRPTLLRVSAFLLVSVIVVAPWVSFTARVSGGPLLDSTSGMNVLLGNHAGATGRLEMADEGRLRQAYVDGASSEADASRRALAAGIAWATAHPGAWLRLAGAKLAWLFGLEGREHAWAYGHGYFGRRSSVTVTIWGALMLLSFPLLCIAAVAGFARAPGEGHAARVAMAAFVAATCALHVASFGESRFHLPLVPVLAVMASLAFAPSGEPRGRRSRLRIAAAAIVLVILGVVWTSQAPELLGALERLRAPDGWMSRPVY